MSKSISFGLGKTKPSAPPKPTFSLPSSKSKPTNGIKSIRDDSDYSDEEEPKHESVTGFSSSGAVLSRPVQQKAERVIENVGNGDWRRRGKNLLPAEVQAARNGEVVMVEKDEVGKASGLHFAQKSLENGNNGTHAGVSDVQSEEPEIKPMTEDEIALAALLDDGSGNRRKNAVIQQMGNARLTGQDETADFRQDVALRPNSSTLEDYAAMPVEEFGMAMLRGMGKKRRANGEVIDLNGEKKDENPRKSRKNEGFLGIGAKAQPGADAELGAWGKADMRKNNKGEGFFTPLMRENRDTGERISEEELQQRVRGQKEKKGDEDWRERRDRNLERSGRDRDDKQNGDQKMLTNGDEYRDQMNDFSRNSSSSRRDRDDRDSDRSRSRRDRDRDDRDYDSSRSRRDRSRSKDRRRRRDDDDYDSRHRDKDDRLRDRR